jgi:hypothetical protein
MVLEATLGHTETETRQGSALLPAAQKRQRDVELRKACERQKQREARQLADRLEVAKGQALTDIDRLRPRLDGDWNEVQDRLFGGINRALTGLAERIGNARNPGELQDIVADAEPLLARAADAQHQQGQIAATQDRQALRATLNPITVDSWTQTNGHRPTGYACAVCRKPFHEPDEDDDGECYCPNCGVLLVTDDNCLKPEDLDSLPPKPRPTLLEALVDHLVAVRSS